MTPNTETSPLESIQASDYEIASLKNHVAGLREMLGKADHDLGATRRERDIYARGLLDITLKVDQSEYAYQIASNAISAASA